MLLGFKERFEKPILDGTKKFTIRKKRRRVPKIGETLYMYKHIRTKNVRKITDQFTLTATQLVSAVIRQDSKKFWTVSIKVDGRRLDSSEIEAFVKADGFESVEDFRDYWLEGVRPDDVGLRIGDFDNHIIYHWTNILI
ncbi:ASCH domain-containing protein [Cecembia rubra]|uniref:ASCH domain-containing protein n=1 Tax=Cecembia rubra TaxID=1485585 RepID=A0A2P8EAR3_9BACT|nr:ASCH domain-containing protein [Cecembia rubra]PSL06561.1 hypothetical protein CLV48_102378 [Cecembia rubra]